ncbi:hypothetical protein B0T26DRAFT_259210 [Lasiosphaeria miniovina]|uniref:C2H2-type domain-containing protein n=1 Tax=Lasiosphaeria miniovina TaxID=1954250 RepID=A0AA40AWK2_9PEZI|nr:uncharacterized protein B0T26DRAFT_259210 [Lasiosphaeria miniovina]KAK0723347.1 hypothetical protein B0T26DRAFT_259210 [Lasiosphaeria miniovina]
MRRNIQRYLATYQCTFCPKRFTRQHNMKSHLRVQTDERPFICTVCGTAFARNYDRKTHEDIHSGEKRFSCKENLEYGDQWGGGADATLNEPRPSDDTSDPKTARFVSSLFLMRSVEKP